MVSTPLIHSASENNTCDVPLAVVEKKVRDPLSAIQRPPPARRKSMAERQEQWIQKKNEKLEKAKKEAMEREVSELTLKPKIKEYKIAAPRRTMSVSEERTAKKLENKRSLPMIKVSDGANSTSNPASKPPSKTGRRNSWADAAIKLKDNPTAKPTLQRKKLAMRRRRAKSKH